MYALPENITGLTGIWAYANYITSNWFSILFVFSIVLISFIAFKVKFYKTSDAFAFSFFFGFLLSTFLWASGLLAGSITLLLLVLFVLSLIYSQVEG